MLIVALGFVSLSGTVARADVGSGTGPGGDGSLQLIPEVITNSGISAGGSNDFPVKAQLFLPAMTDRAQGRAKSEAAALEGLGMTSFTPHANPLFAEGFADVRGALFANYAPRVIPSADDAIASQADDLWYLVMVAAAIPLTILAGLLGRKNASRRLKKA